MNLTVRAVLIGDLRTKLLKNALQKIPLLKEVSVRALLHFEYAFLSAQNTFLSAFIVKLRDAHYRALKKRTHQLLSPLYAREKSTLNFNCVF